MPTFLGEAVVFGKIPRIRTSAASFFFSHFESATDTRTSNPSNYTVECFLAGVASLIVLFFCESFGIGSYIMADFLLFESPLGYSLFKVTHQGDTVGNDLKEVQAGINDLAKFGKMVELTSFAPFEYALSANMKDFFMVR